MKKKDLKESQQTSRDEPPDKRYNSRQNRVSDQNDGRTRQHREK
jgi:hypothetical protein